jgi:hypothetical protein
LGSEPDFRKKYPAEYRTADGRWVRSKSEKIVAGLYLVSVLTGLCEAANVAKQRVTIYVFVAFKPARMAAAILSIPLPICPIEFA